ncbi:unnamed protein product, partial [Brassica oleracea]
MFLGLPTMIIFLILSTSWYFTQHSKKVIRAGRAVTSDSREVQSK